MPCPIIISTIVVVKKERPGTGPGKNGEKVERGVLLFVVYSMLDQFKTAGLGCGGQPRVACRERALQPLREFQIGRIVNT